MYSYFIGKIVDKNNTEIIIDVNNIGYNIIVDNVKKYEINNTETVYIYEHLKENVHDLYGFNTKEARNLFKVLLAVKGLGPKSILKMFNTSSINEIQEAIINKNTEFFLNFNKIGIKLATEIINTFSNKHITETKNLTKKNDLINALKELGYQKQEINNALNNLKFDKDISLKELIKLAILNIQITNN